MGNFFLVSGNDEFAIKARAREHIVSLCSEEFEANPDLEIIKGDAEGVSLTEILAQFIGALKTPPFLTVRKVVWLRNFNYFAELCSSSASNQILTMAAELAEFFKQPLPNDVVVVIDGADLDQRKSLFKTFKAIPGAEIDFYRKADLADRNYNGTQAEKVTALVRGYKKQIAPDAIEYLIQAAGTDYGRMLKEVGKLVTYVGDENKKITLEDCRNICSRTPEALGWEFARALTDGDSRAALAAADLTIRQLRGMGGSGNIELGLVSQASRAFREIAETKLAITELNLPEHIGSNYFYNVSEELKERYPDNILLKLHPFRAFKLTEQAAKFSGKRLSRIFQALLDANRNLVSGGGEPRIILERLILDITSR